MNFNLEKFSEQYANKSHCSITINETKKLLPLKDNHISIMQKKSLVINQHYTNNEIDEKIPEKECFLTLDNPNIQLVSINECIINGQKKNINIEQKSNYGTSYPSNSAEIVNKDISLGQISYGSEIIVTFEIKIIPYHSIFLSFDLETPSMPYKIGQTIFDLAIVAYCCGKEKTIFESNKWFNFTIRRPLEFEDYAPIMIYKIYEYCSITPHDQIYFIAHNGFQHDFIILFDNLEKSGYINVFEDFFNNSYFLDSMNYFYFLKNNGNLDQMEHCTFSQIKNLKLNYLYNFFVRQGQQPKMQSHTAKCDAKDLIDLMSYAAFPNSFTFFDDIINFQSDSDIYLSFKNYANYYKGFKRGQVEDLNQLRREYNLVKPNFALHFEKYHKNIEFFSTGDDFYMNPKYDGFLVKQLQAAFLDANIDLSNFDIYNNFFLMGVNLFTFYDWSKLPESAIKSNLKMYNVPADKIDEISSWCMGLSANFEN